MRMLEAREDAPLARESGKDFVRRHAAAQELDRDALVEEAVGALGEEDLAHAAAPEPAEHPVGTDALRRRSFVRDPRESVEKAARDGHGRRLEKAAGFGVGREELANALGEIAVGERGEAALSFGRRELDELLEERPDLGPAPAPFTGR